MKTARLLPLIAVLTLAARPDEGEWLPQQILAMDWSELQARGLKLTKDEFWNPEKGGVLSATVQLGGCSASFVSPEGLVVTNHHCGFSAVQQLSTVDNNYLENGFVAASRDKELPAPGVVVYVVRRIRDVTEEVHAAQARAETDLERARATDRAIAKLVQEGQQEPNTVCNVSSFLEGEQYLLYYRTRLPDVRLVCTPPRSVGEFGGEVDNWEWPRHTGDFTFLRAYVAPDGTPRPYDASNVPYHPEHYLKVSGKGVQNDDLVLIMGYPGRTERYLTSVAVADRQSITYPMRYELYTGIIGVLEHAGEGDPAKALEYASLVKSLANVQKNALGMIKGLARNGVVSRKLREEKQFEAWVESTEARRHEYGTVLADILELDQQARQTANKDTLLGLLGSSRLNPLLSTLISALARSPKADDELGAIFDQQVSMLSRILRQESIEHDLEKVQLPILQILLDEARRLPKDQRLGGTEELTAAPDSVPTSVLVGDLLQRSEMLDADARVALFSDPAKLAKSKDPLIVLARGLLAELRERAQRHEVERGRRLVVGQRWIRAQQEWRGKAFYPDANSTLRVSIATVKGYSPRDGVLNVPHTTVAGILEKETGKVPFASPKALLEAAAQRSKSRFFDPAIGDVPVCFLSDGDTTGGNSGSPVINGRGELVGLNFDRVFENVAGDYGWRPECSRNISVDIRYVLWFLDQVMPAPHLLKELGV